MLFNGTMRFCVNSFSLEITLDKPADFLDAATEIAEAFTEAAIQRVRGESAPQSHPDFDGENCIECADALPPLRLTMGKIRCVYCQGALERKNSAR